MDKIQEKYYEIQMISSHMEEIEKNIQKIDEQIEEIDIIIESLNDIKKVKKDNEILTPISNGIFVKSKIIETEKLIVNIGQNVLVEKNVEDTKKLISKQLIELEEYKNLLADELNKLSNKALQIEKEADEMVKKDV
jgi:prefoldin alpha subunit